MVFIPVHLSARIELYFFEDATAHRAVEADVLAKLLDAVEKRFDDRDVVVLGDFNTEMASEDIGEALVKRGRRDLNCANAATYEYGMPLDRFYGFRELHPQVGERIMRNLASLLSRRLGRANMRITMLGAR